jgi:hypothetical protein
MERKKKYVYKVVAYDRHRPLCKTVEVCDKLLTAFRHAERWNVEHGYGMYDCREIGTGDRFADVKEVEIDV